jgi:hypothetical protein
MGNEQTFGDLHTDADKNVLKNLANMGKHLKELNLLVIFAVLLFSWEGAECQKPCIYGGIKWTNFC